MSISAALPKSEDLRELPLAVPLDEAVWQAWVLKGRAREERRRAVLRRVVKCISLAGLLFAAAAGIWPDLMPYDVFVRFIVAAGAAVLMFRAFSLRDYIFGTLFGVLALLYNPVAPVFSLSGEWQRVLVVVSAFPFIASLTRRDAKLVPNEQN